MPRPRSERKQTAYGVLMDDVRKKERRRARDPKGVLTKQEKAGGKCGATKSSGGLCRHPAGFGTEHFGIGRCKYHGGTTPAHNASAARKEAILLGAPKEINPIEAIMWSIRLTAGEVEFYTEQIQEINEINWVEEHPVLGKQMHLFARERALCMDRLVQYSKIAVSLGLTERAVKLAETYGSTIARLIRGVLDDLMPYISVEGQALIPQIVRKHLLLAESRSDTIANTAMKALPS